MTFQEGGSFGGDRVQTRRGGGRAVVAGGGVVGLVVALIAIFGGPNLAPLLDGVTGAGGGTEEVGTVGVCSAEEANTDERCRLSATLDSLDTFWVAQAEQDGGSLEIPEAVTFDAATTTACGDATSATGPFYCPPDQTIYLDLTFYDLLRERFGTTGGPLAQMYVVAHEYGHHVQQVTGVMDAADRGGSGADSDSVRIELQADCYAGLWAGHAASTVDPDTGVTYLEPITAQELADALSAAEAIGDDHIQESSGGQVDPDTWTHGSSAQRERWFTTGYEQGTVEACDTFATDDL